MSIPPLIRYMTQNNKQQFQQVYNQQRNACGVTTQMFQLFCAKNLTKDQIDKMNIEQRDSTMKSLLFYAVAGDQNVNYCEALDPLITKQDAYQSTALMYASKFGRVQWVQYLVEDEAGFKDLQGRSALLYCIGSLAQIQEEYLKFSDVEVEVKLKIIDFLFDYEWFILDNQGKSCIDYLRQTKIDRAFVQYLENRFVKHCIAYGTPKGILLDDREEQLKTRSDQQSKGQNPRITSIFQHVSQLNEEIMKWKAIVSKMNEINTETKVSAQQEQINQLTEQNNDLQLQIVKMHEELAQQQRQQDSKMQATFQNIESQNNLIAEKDLEIMRLKKEIEDVRKAHMISNSIAMNGTSNTFGLTGTDGVDQNPVSAPPHTDNASSVAQQPSQGIDNAEQPKSFVTTRNKKQVKLDENVMKIINENNVIVDNQTPNKHFQKPIFDVNIPKSTRINASVYTNNDDEGEGLSAAQKKRQEMKEKIKARLSSLDALK